MNDTTDDGFLGNRLKILQPRKGYRAGLDAVMVAAAVPAKPGDKIFEAGIGTGVAALCLAKRVPDITITGVEINPDYAALATQNIARNGFDGAIEVVEGDMADLARLGKDNFQPGTFDHAFANPPYREAGRSRAPQDKGRAIAHVSDQASIIQWVEQMLALVKDGGTVTMILPEMVLRSFTHFAGHGLNILPLLAHENTAATRKIYQWQKSCPSKTHVLPALILHERDGTYTNAAEQVLRLAGAIIL